MADDRATLWQMIGPQFDHDFHHDVRFQIGNLLSFGPGVTINRWILDWYAYSDTFNVDDLTGTPIPWKIAVYAEDGRAEGDIPDIFDHTLAWQFNELFRQRRQLILLGGGTELAVNYEASAAGTLLDSHGQRTQKDETFGLSFWVLWGPDHAAAIPSESDLDMKVVWQLRYLVQFPPGVTPP